MFKRMQLKIPLSSLKFYNYSKISGYVTVLVCYFSQTEAKALNTLRVSLSYQEARLRDAILKKLIDNDATFYGASWCGVTKKQLAELKITETDTRGLDYVDCEREDELCASKGVDAYPTWQINGQKYTGYHPLDKLAELLTEKQ